MADASVPGDRRVRIPPKDKAAQNLRLKQRWIAEKVTRFRGLKRERLHFFFYDDDLGAPVGDIYFEGAPDHVMYDLPLVLRSALLRSGTMIVMGHNHPLSHDARPSRKDTIETKRVITACRLVGISLHDHFIVAGEEYFSMRDHGLL